MDKKKLFKKKLKDLKSDLKMLKKIKDSPQEAIVMGKSILINIKELQSFEEFKSDEKIKTELNKAYDMISLYVKNIQEMEKVKEKWKKK